MSEKPNNQINSEEEIDVVELLLRLWRKRWFIVKGCLVGGVIGIVIAFSIPKEYSTVVKMVPEVNSVIKGNIGSFAAIAGINLNQNSSEIPPELYPEIVKSTPFLLGLLDLNVVDKVSEVDTTLFSYLNNHQRFAWWSYVYKYPVKILRWLRSKDVRNVKISANQKIISLTGEQRIILNSLNNKISVSVDTKSGTISMKVNMQSAQISAFLADTLSSYMQHYIINFRTEKARRDLAFTQELYEEVKQKYYEAQLSYAEHIDRNKGTVMASTKAVQERLQNEMNLTYSVYNQMAQQLQVALIKVQDITPVCRIIQPAVLPLVPSAPRKVMILFVIVFFTFVVICGWIVLGNDTLSHLKRM